VVMTLLAAAGLGAWVWFDNLTPEAQLKAQGFLLGIGCGVPAGLGTGVLFALWAAARSRRPVTQPPAPTRPTTERPIMVLQPSEGPDIRWPSSDRWTPSSRPARRDFDIIGEDFTE